MARDLGNARKNKNDEFYTQFSDIQKEMNAYLEYDPNVFKNKTIFINIIGNVIIYIPLGIILYKKIYYGSLIIVILECLQYLLSRGIFDIMDIILNFIGMIIGMIGVLLCQKIKKKKSQNEMKKFVKRMKK